MTTYGNYMKHTQSTDRQVHTHTYTKEYRIPKNTANMENTNTDKLLKSSRNLLLLMHFTDSSYFKLGLLFLFTLCKWRFSWPRSVARKFKSREVAQRQNNVISGFIRSVVLNTSTLTPCVTDGVVHYSLLCANDCDFVV